MQSLMYKFKKEERLCSKKLLDQLFRNGSSFLIYPFRVVHLPLNTSGEPPVKVVIGTSKRKFKRAVDRNLIKRRTREAYRLHKNELLYSFLQGRNVSLLLSLQYIGKDIADFSLFDKKMKLVFKQLEQQYAEPEPRDSEVQSGGRG